MNEDLIVLLMMLGAFAVSVWIGAAIGNLAGKGNAKVGGYLGLLGPVGWIIAAVLPPRAMAKRQAEAVRVPTLKAVDPLAAWEKEQEIRSGPPAPREGWRERVKE
jgi:hypothetical protein